MYLFVQTPWRIGEMPKSNYFFTSESVTEGHPDKMADQISDGILDAILAQDPHARVACEALLKTGLVVLAGEITSTATVDYPAIVREIVRDIGYTDSSLGFDAETCAVLVAVEQQSPDIAKGVDTEANKEQGAGDQGMMFGYACDESEELMPLPILMAHKLTRRLAEVRKNKTLGFLRPDGKSQVTYEYRNGKPTRIDSVVISSQHDDIDMETVRAGIKKEVIDAVLPADHVDEKTRYYINPTGRFVIGGPLGDAGLTGRKIIVDTYGGMGHHGGGAFSGKDPSKVDRSAAYMGRYIAKNLVAAGLANRCEVQLSYAIGIAEPMSVLVDTFGTSSIPEDKLADLVREQFPLRPAEIIKHLDLLRPIFRQTATYGHFGREDNEFTWEKTDKAAELQRAAAA